MEIQINNDMRLCCWNGTKYHLMAHIFLKHFDGAVKAAMNKISWIKQHGFLDLYVAYMYIVAQMDNI